MFNKLKQVKDLRDKAKHLQSILGDVVVEGSAGWGKVKISMNGNQAVTSVSIDPSYLAPSEKTKLEAAVKDAVNDAQKKAQQKMVEKMKETGDFKMPGLE
ncbi:MAG: YbaB/EbfC family nucleoid-associated protein [Patescibacteria group bacterium]|nr:YbaB/EbfC family nucleoid-associated protein [Patescibacteria group bacterium]